MAIILRYVVTVSVCLTVCLLLSDCSVTETLPRFRYRSYDKSVRPQQM